MSGGGEGAPAGRDEGVQGAGAEAAAGQLRAGGGEHLSAEAGVRAQGEPGESGHILPEPPGPHPNPALRCAFKISCSEERIRYYGENSL